MTINKQYTPGKYNGNGSLTTYPIPWEADITPKVTLRVASTGVLSVKTEGIDYEVEDKNIVFYTAPASTDQVLIEVDPDYLQETWYYNNQVLNTTNYEGNLDNLYVQDQLLKEILTRALILDPDSTLTTFEIQNPGPLRYLRFNYDVTAIEAVDLSDDSILFNIVEDTSPQLGGDLDTGDYTISPRDGDGIIDSNSNELLKFNETASAVSYIDLNNEPKITVVGSETNTGLNLKAKGSGTIQFKNDNYTLKSPVSDGSANQYLYTDGAGQLAFKSLTLPITDDSGATHLGQVLSSSCAVLGSDLTQDYTDSPITVISRSASSISSHVVDEDNSYLLFLFRGNSTIHNEAVGYNGEDYVNCVARLDVRFYDGISLSSPIVPQFDTGVLWPTNNSTPDPCTINWPIYASYFIKTSTFLDNYTAIRLRSLVVNNSAGSAWEVIYRAGFRACVYEFDGRGIRSV